MPPDDDMTIGEIGRLLKEVRDDVKVLKEGCPNRKIECNTEYYGHLAGVKEVIQTNKADVDWLKRGFWYIAGVGTSALLLVIGLIISTAIMG